MDKIISQYDFISDNDLNICQWEGIAYQANMGKGRKDYGGNYFGYCQGKYTNKERKAQINSGRVEFVKKYYKKDMLDIGIGAGDFIKVHGNAWGVDVDREAVEWLKTNHRLAEKIEGFGAYTMWDVLEHIENPEIYFKHMNIGAWLFISIPIFKDLKKIRESKHYLPGEHLYYFTEIGLLRYLKDYGFECNDIDDFEIRAGRENIYNYAFQRISK